jgi:hypothetical protein
VTLKIRINPKVSYSVHLLKKDSSVIVIPHYYAEYQEEAIVLSKAEYSDHT